MPGGPGAVPGVPGPADPAPGAPRPAPAVPAPAGPAPDGPASDGPAPDDSVPYGSVPRPARPGLVRARRTRRGNSACAAGSTGPPTSRGPARPVIALLAGELSDTWPGAGTWSRRCRPAGGTLAEPPTAGGPGLVLPRDRDPPGPGRMYRRTRSKSRSRISRTPSDRVPGCQRMTKLRERHLPLPVVTGYGSRTVTERLLSFTDEAVWAWLSCAHVASRCPICAAHVGLVGLLVPVATEAGPAGGISGGGSLPPAPRRPWTVRIGR